jgi:hypothetical protein
MPLPKDLTNEQALLAKLERGPAIAFKDGVSQSIPLVAAGVYTIWRADQFLYVGMAGRGLSTADIASGNAGQVRRRGLADRLASHATGRRSGDQFCVYIADRLILATLMPDQVAQIADGALSLDHLTRAFIHSHLSYRFVEMPSGSAALELEKAVQSGCLQAGRPWLNPR